MRNLRPSLCDASAEAAACSNVLHEITVRRRDCIRLHTNKVDLPLLGVRSVKLELVLNARREVVELLLPSLIVALSSELACCLVSVAKAVEEEGVLTHVVLEGGKWQLARCQAVDKRVVQTAQRGRQSIEKQPRGERQGRHRRVRPGHQATTLLGRAVGTLNVGGCTVRGQQSEGAHAQERRNSQPASGQPRAIRHRHSGWRGAARRHGTRRPGSECGSLARDWRHSQVCRARESDGCWDPHQHTSRPQMAAAPEDRNS